jgi:phosphoglycolate phosphatase
MSLRLAVFDCDGTLVDGQGAVCAAMDEAFAAVGLPSPDRHQVRRAVGLSLPLVVAELLPEAEESLRREVEQGYRSAYFRAREAGLLTQPLYDGMAELVHALHADGWLLGIATGKGLRGLQHVLATHDLGELFLTLQTADRHPSKPHPAMLEAALAEAGAGPGEAVMIGDTSFDMLMAQSAGVRAIGVDWGYHNPDELRAAGADAIAATPAALKELLR